MFSIFRHKHQPQNNSTNINIIIEHVSNTTKIVDNPKQYQNFYISFMYKTVTYRTQNKPAGDFCKWRESFDIVYERNCDPTYIRFHLVGNNLKQHIYVAFADIAISELKIGLPSSREYFIQSVVSPHRQGSLHVTLLATETKNALPQVVLNNHAFQKQEKSQVITELVSILPTVPRTKVEKAVEEFNGDKEKALAKLLDDNIKICTSHKHQTQTLNAPCLGDCNTNTPNSYGPEFNSIQATGNSTIHHPTGSFYAPVNLHTPSVVTPYQATGRCKTLLIGINYHGSSIELVGANTDAHRFRNLLVNLYGFPSFAQAMVTLTDEALDKKYRPTRKNIIYAMKWLVCDAKPGDVFVFYYSGHGTQLRDPTNREADGMDEAIMPEDYMTEGPIRDNDLHDILVAGLPSGVRLIAVIDCCHSGTALDLPFNFNLNGKRWEQDAFPYLSAGDVQLIAACDDSQSSLDLKRAAARTAGGGALTTALITSLMNKPYNSTFVSLLFDIHDNLQKRGLTNQNAQLSSSQPFSPDRLFNFRDIIPNMNPILGQISFT